MSTPAPANHLKLVFFDMDGVIFDVGEYHERSSKLGVSTWHALFDHLGILNEHRRLKTAFINGQFSSYMEWTDEACCVLQQHGLTESEFNSVLNGRPFMPGARDAVATLHNRGYTTAIITGSFRYLADRAAAELGIDNVVAHCDLSFDSAGRLDGWYLTPCDYEGKSDYFHRLARTAKVTPEQCAYIGDEVNDITIFGEVGLSMAFNSHKPAVSSAAQIVIDRRDLRAILDYLP